MALNNFLLFFSLSLFLDSWFLFYEWWFFFGGDGDGCCCCELSSSSSFGLVINDVMQMKWKKIKSFITIHTHTRNTQVMYEVMFPKNFNFLILVRCFFFFLLSSFCSVINDKPSGSIFFRYLIFIWISFFCVMVVIIMFFIHGKNDRPEVKVMKLKMKKPTATGREWNFGNESCNFQFMMMILMMMGCCSQRWWW